ncbi:hypothetical protein GCM10008929_03500 [Alkalibacterium psychrotolerans]
MVIKKNIPNSYKYTEAGIIPGNWNSMNVKDLVSFSGGAQPPKTTFRKERKPGYIRLIQIRDYKNDNYLTFIPEVLAKKKCSTEDIMIGRYGPPIFQILRGISGAYNVALMKATPKEKIEKKYLYYFLKQESLFKFIELLSRRSSGQTGIDIVALNNYPVALPPIEEQKAIAEVLTDTDNLIQSLEKLIDKKKKIKKGAMQQLLTGKKRLPGFNREWITEKIKNIASISTGSKNTQDNNPNGAYPFFVRSLTVERIDSYSFEGEAVLTAGDGVGTGKVFHYIDGKFDFHQRVYKISDFNSQVNGYYFYLYFSFNFLNRIMAMTAKSSVDSVRMEMIADMEILLPEISEQKAIAEVLSDMDAEIKVLEEKLEKYKKIKQGMMQELLTGRIRLI